MFNMLGFNFSRSPVSLASCLSCFLFFPETQIRQEAFSFEEVHGYGYKQASLQKVTFETLPSSWKFETREVSELIRGSLLPLKISSFMSPQMFLAPPCWTLYPLCLRSLLSTERTTFIFSILFPDHSFWFFFHSRGWNIPHKTTPSPSSQRSLSFVDNIHHHPLWLNPQSGSFKPPIIRVYDPSTSEQADHPSPPGEWRFRDSDSAGLGSDLHISDV